MLNKLIVTCFVFVLTTFSVAESAHAELQSLRDDKIDETSAPQEAVKQIKGEVFKRHHKDEPPLIPHKVSHYKISLKYNRCLACHDKKFYKEEEAPKTGDSHYINTAGKAVDKVDGLYYPCLQCHVPQLDAKELVGNNF